MEGFLERRKHWKFYFAHKNIISQEDDVRLRPILRGYQYAMLMGIALGIGLLWPVVRLPPYKSIGIIPRKTVRVLTVAIPITYAHVTYKRENVDPFFAEMFKKYNPDASSPIESSASS